MLLLLVPGERGESADRIARMVYPSFFTVPFFCVHSKRCWWDGQQKARRQETVCFLLQARENQANLPSHLTCRTQTGPFQASVEVVRLRVTFVQTV